MKADRPNTPHVSSEIISLTTDFGEQDSYVAQMKGVILGITPNVQIIDVTHHIAPQSILQAACLLPDLAHSFPEGSLHVVVVDPGVGSNRRILAVEADGQRFIAPDNGLLDLVMNDATSVNMVELTNQSFWRQPVSNTFHGRDIMAPVAAHWSQGARLHELGAPLESEPVALSLNQPILTGESLSGEVIHIDHFGNVITNIKPQHLKQLTDTDPANEMQCMVSIGSHCFNGIQSTYSEVEIGKPVLLWGSSHFLELAVNGGHAKSQFKISTGTPVSISLKQPT